MPTKVTIGKSDAAAEPAPAKAKAATENLVVTDSRGRKLEVRKLSLWEEMNLMVTAGPERSSIDKWMQYASVIACVRKVDDDLIPPPQTLRILQGNIQWVGSEGFAAAVQALSKDLPEEVAAAFEKESETAKN